MKAIIENGKINDGIPCVKNGNNVTVSYIY